MKKVMTSLYSQYELFTRQDLFSKLTGVLRFTPFDGGKCDAVLLNFETDRFSASETFSELKRNGMHVIVYTDRYLSPVIKNHLMNYERCSLIIRPEEYEVEKARHQFEKNGIYHYNKRHCNTSSFPAQRNLWRLPEYTRTYCICKRGILNRDFEIITFFSISPHTIKRSCC